MVLFQDKTMAGIFNYLVSFWEELPFGQLDPLDKQIRSELKVWKHLQSVFDRGDNYSIEDGPSFNTLAVKDIQQLHLAGFVGTDAHVQKLRAKLLLGPASSSSQFSLVEDVAKELVRKMVASSTEIIWADESAFALFKEVLNIPGFPEEKILEIFSPIFTSPELFVGNVSAGSPLPSGCFFARLLSDDLTADRDDLLLYFVKLIPKDLNEFFLTVFYQTPDDFSPERMNRFLEMSLSLDRGWIDSNPGFLIYYCRCGFISDDNLKKIINSIRYIDPEMKKECFSYLLGNKKLLDSQGIAGLVKCAECFGEKPPVYEWIISWAQTPSGKKYLSVEYTRHLSLTLILNFFYNFEGRVLDDDVGSFIDVYLDFYFRSPDKFLVNNVLNAIRMNHRLEVSGDLLARVLRLLTEEKVVKNRNDFFVAIQNCDSIKDVEDYFLIEKKKEIPETIGQFLSLPIEHQQHLMTGFVLFRDRKGLQLVSELLKQAGSEKVATPLLKSALTLLKKTQILHDPDADETHLLNLIFSLWISTSGNGHREMEHVLGEAVLALSELDFVRLKSQYRSGIFEIFKTLVNNGRADPSVLNVFIGALGLYSYDPSIIEDREILDFLIPLMKRESTPGEIKFFLAKMLSKIKYEPALLSAWDVIKGPLWDRYARHEEGEERKVIHGDFDLYNFLPFHLHENRGVIKRRILDLLAELNLKDKDLPALFKEFYERNPDKLRALSKFLSSLEVMPFGGVRYFDPLYLPKGSFVFRGINGRKGDTRALDGLLDLFERGAGDSELTKANADSGTWAKVGQIFCALDKQYVQSYVGELGAFIVIKGDYVNQAIQKRRVRQQREVGSTHYVLYDTISHQNIEKIYIAKSIFSELQKLRNTDPNSIDPSKFSIFNYLSKEELGRFIRALKSDPHHLFEKLEASNTFYRDLSTTKEPETSFEQVISYNAEKEAARQLMEEKYASHFVPPTKSRL